MPPWLPARVEYIDGLKQGGRAVMSLAAGPSRFEWESTIREVERGSMFRDVQVRGPFREWEHRHMMVPDGPTASRLVDEITMSLPSWTGYVSALPERVHREIDRIFARRHAVTKADLEFLSRYPFERPLRIAISGASGMIGSALASFLDAAGHRVLRLVRTTPEQDNEILFDYREDALEVKRLEGLDAVIHLAGEPLASLYWSEARRMRIYASRVQSTQFLAKALSRLDRKPRVFLTASSTGIYGDRRDEPLDERSPRSDTGFLAVLSRDWEAATDEAADAGIRTAHLRFGLVTTPLSTIVQLILHPMRAGLGARIRGRNGDLSWISLDDAVHAAYHVLLSSDLQGPVNLVAPEPTTRHDFVRELAQVRGARVRLALPEAKLRSLLGDVARDVMLLSQRIHPWKLTEGGFIFAHPRLEDALRHEFGVAS